MTGQLSSYLLWSQQRLIFPKQVYLRPISTRFLRHGLWRWHRMQPVVSSQLQANRNISGRDRALEIVQKKTISSRQKVHHHCHHFPPPAKTQNERPGLTARDQSKPFVFISVKITGFICLISLQDD